MGSRLARNNDTFFQDRIIYLSDDVESTTIGEINSYIISLIQEDDEEDERHKDYRRTPIRLYVNSYGGSVYDMWSLIDIIEQSKTPIYTYCTGYAMSAGFKIFLAGHKRFASRHATFLYHQLSGWAKGHFSFMENRMEEYKRQQGLIEEYVSERTKIKPEQLKDIREKKHDWYISSEEAMKLGIATDFLGA